MTLSLATLVTGVLLALRLSGVDALTAPRILAVALLVVGGGLLVGAWVGRARWLIAVGLALALVLLPYAALDGRLTGGAGERTWVPTATATDQPAYRLGAGEAVLDLRELEPPFDAPITEASSVRLPSSARSSFAVPPASRYARSGVPSALSSRYITSNAPSPSVS